LTVCRGNHALRTSVRVRAFAYLGFSEDATPCSALSGWRSLLALRSIEMKLSLASLRRLRDRSRARHDGKRDGRMGIPTRDEVVHPPALLQIALRADEAVAELARLWANEDCR
jgi:hypothetical protein